MIMLPCPWCGARAGSEFRYSGEVIDRPDPGTTTAAQWRDYLYLRDNPRGWVTEWWYHRAGCRKYFTIDRDTRTDETRARGDSGGASPRAGTARGEELGAMSVVPEART